MSAKPTISVVVPTYRRLSRIPDLVQNYVAQGADEIVVILDGPHDDWRTALRATMALPGVVVEELPANGGLALARVAGLRLTRGDIVLMADDDVFPAPGHIDAHRAFHAANPGSALLGYMPVALPQRRGRDQAATFLYARDYENQVAEWRPVRPKILLESFWGGNASLPRDLYLRAEAYKPSERLNYYEDVDLGLRLQAIGAKVSFDEKARAAHRHQRGFVAFKRECEVRGEAAVDLERRWTVLPERFKEFVSVPPDHNVAVAAIQRRIGARDKPGLLEAGIDAAYWISGILRLWSLQEALARLIRRALGMRGYRISSMNNLSRS